MFSYESIGRLDKPLFNSKHSTILLEEKNVLNSIKCIMT